LRVQPDLRSADHARKKANKSSNGPQNALCFLRPGQLRRGLSRWVSRSHPQAARKLMQAGPVAAIQVSDPDRRTLLGPPRIRFRLHSLIGRASGDYGKWNERPSRVCLSDLCGQRVPGFTLHSHQAPQVARASRSSRFWALSSCRKNFFNGGCAKTSQSH
jgi:hypothetical protein